MDPQILYLILCDGVRESPKNLLRASIDGLQIRIRSRGALPVKHNMTVLAMLYGYRGRGLIWVQVIEEATDTRIVASTRRPVSFPTSDDEVFGIRFDLLNCPLPRHGRYRVELLDGPEVLAWKPFWLVAKE